MSSPRTLVVFHKQLGDLLLLEPAISVLAERDQAPVALTTRSGHEPLGHLLPNVVWMPHPGFRRFATAWGFDGSRKTALRVRACRAGSRHLRLDPDTLAAWYHPLLFKDIRSGKRRSDYIAQYYWQMVDPPKGAVFRRPQLRPPPGDWQIPSLPERYLLANVTAGWRSKCWHSPSWIEALKRISEATLLPVVLTSGDQEWQREHAGRVFAGLPDAINLGGKTRLTEFIRLIHRASLVVTVDGFAGHLATAYDIPCVTLFAGSTVNNWFCSTPRSKAVVASEVLRAPSKLSQLPPRPVIDAALSLM